MSWKTHLKTTVLLISATATLLAVIEWPLAIIPVLAAIVGLYSLSIAYRELYKVIADYERSKEARNGR